MRQCTLWDLQFKETLFSDFWILQQVFGPLEYVQKRSWGLLLHHWAPQMMSRWCWVHQNPDFPIPRCLQNPVLKNHKYHLGQGGWFVYFRCKTKIFAALHRHFNKSLWHWTGHLGPVRAAFRDIMNVFSISTLRMKLFSWIEYELLFFCHSFS